MSTTHDGECRPGLNAKFWVPILITALFACTSFAWALFERANTTIVERTAEDNKKRLDVVIDRNIAQDQQILLIMQRMDQQQKTIDETLDLLKKHVGMK